MHQEEALIKPKKLINPCLESKERKNLHRELLFNQKIGKTVLNQKSELQKVFKERKQRDLKPESTVSGSSFDNELEKKIGQLKARAEGSVVQNDNEELNEEYLRIRLGLKHKQNNDV